MPSIVTENPHGIKMGFRLSPITLNPKWKLKLFYFFSAGVTDHVWTADGLLSPFFSRGFYVIQKGKKVNWKLIPMGLINGHWRMHSNLCTVQLFRFEPHTGNYSLLSAGVNVFVAPCPPLKLSVLFPSFYQRMQVRDVDTCCWYRWSLALSLDL